MPSRCGVSSFRPPSGRRGASSCRRSARRQLPLLLGEVGVFPGEPVDVVGPAAAGLRRVLPHDALRGRLHRELAPPSSGSAGRTSPGSPCRSPRRSTRDGRGTAGGPNSSQNPVAVRMTVPGVANDTSPGGWPWRWRNTVRVPLMRRNSITTPLPRSNFQSSVSRPSEWTGHARVRHVDRERECAALAAVERYLEALDLGVGRFPKSMLGGVWAEAAAQTTARTRAASAPTFVRRATRRH